MKKFTPEFKDALKRLPEKEKDKLIARLLKHDEILANRLYFELLQPASVENLREELKTEIASLLNSTKDEVYLPYYTLWDLKELSGKITRHVAITRDKYGEIELQLTLIASYLMFNLEALKRISYKDTFKVNSYLIARLYLMLTKWIKLDEDFRYDFKEILETIAMNMNEIPNVVQVAEENELNLNWLMDYDIPEDIVERHTVLKAKGKLRTIAYV